MTTTGSTKELELSQTVHRNFRLSRVLHTHHLRPRLLTSPHPPLSWGKGKAAGGFPKNLTSEARPLCSASPNLEKLARGKAPELETHSWCGREKAEASVLREPQDAPGRAGPGNPRLEPAEAPQRLEEAL